VEIRLAVENVAEKSMVQEQIQGWVACLFAFFTKTVVVGE
jgi:hypothetical protein